MGAISSTGASDPLEQADHLNVPIRAPQIVNSVAAVHFAQVTAPRRTPSPKQINVTRRKIPYMIQKDSIVCRQLEDSNLSIGFRYRSDCEVTAKAEWTPRGSSSLAETVCGPSKTWTEGTCAIHAVDSSTGENKLELRLCSTEHELLVQGVVVDRQFRVQRMTFLWKETEESVDILNLFVTEASPALEQSQSCVVCFSDPPTVGFLPCRHMCVCKGCASVTLASTGNHCPLCRAEVSGRISLDS